MVVPAVVDVVEPVVVDARGGRLSDVVVVAIQLPQLPAGTDQRKDEADREDQRSMGASTVMSENYDAAGTYLTTFGRRVGGRSRPASELFRKPVTGRIVRGSDKQEAGLCSGMVPGRPPDRPLQ